MEQSLLWRVATIKFAGGIPLRAANSIGLTPHWGAQTFEFEKAADEVSSTGGRRRLSPRPLQGHVFNSHHSG